MMRIIFLFALMCSISQAFVVVPERSLARQSSVKPLAMSSEPIGEDMMGETEKLLLAAKERRDSGIIKEYGKTILNDGYDDVRALVWGIFDITNIVFPLLGAALTAGLLLNMMGYGYYFDPSHGLVIDTLQNIQQDQFFQEEAAKLAASAVEKAGSMY